MRYILFLIGLIFLFSCSESKKEIQYDLELKHELIPIKGFGRPVRLKIDSEKRLLIVLMRDGNNLANAYDLDSFEWINSFIKKGEGPNEQVIGWTLQIDYKNGIIYSTDPVKKRLYGYSIDSVLVQNSGFAPSNIIDLRKVSPQRPLVISESKIIDFRENYIFKDSFAYQLMDFEGNFLEAVGVFPKTQSEISNYQQSAAFMGDFNISYDQNFIIRNYSFADRLEKLDLNGEVIKMYQGPLNIEPSFVTEDLGEGSTRVIPDRNSLKAFVKQVAIGENRIFAMFDGKDFYRDDEQSNTLMEFDLDLNLKRVMRLDQRILSFDIDWKENALYGFSADFEDHFPDSSDKCNTKGLRKEA